MTRQFSANGKLLLTGEYLVLLGAKAIAFPTAYGQTLTVNEETNDEHISWRSLNHLGETWFYCSLDLDLNILDTSDKGRAFFLQSLLKAAAELSTYSLRAVSFQSRLEFPNDWGLGSSSTLIYLVSQYFGVDHLKLHFKVSSGSGYDIVCAGVHHPILYSLSKGIPFWQEICLPDIFDDAYFIHLGEKQNTQTEVQKFLEHRSKQAEKLVSVISEISEAMPDVRSGEELIDLIESHENLMSSVLERPTVKKSLFPEYKGAVKSLGAWGGDFVMAFGENTENYFREKGYITVLPYRKIVK